MAAAAGEPQQMQEIIEQLTKRIEIDVLAKKNAAEAANKEREAAAEAANKEREFAANAKMERQRDLEKQIRKVCMQIKDLERDLIRTKIAHDKDCGLNGADRSKFIAEAMKLGGNVDGEKEIMNRVHNLFTKCAESVEEVLYTHRHIKMINSELEKLSKSEKDLLAELDALVNAGNVPAMPPAVIAPAPHC